MPTGGGAPSDDACFRPAPDQFQIRTNEAGKLATFVKARIDALAGGVAPPPAAPGDPGANRCAAANAIGIPAANPTPQAYGFDAQRLDVQRHRPQATARHPRRRRRHREPHARCRPHHPGRLQRPGRRRQQRPDLQRHPGQRDRRDAQRHRGGHVQPRLPHGVPVWSGRPAAVVVGELPRRPDRGQLGHREARRLQPGLRLLPGAERRHRGRGRLLQRRHAGRGCRSHLVQPAAPARHPARHGRGQPHQGSDRRPDRLLPPGRRRGHGARRCHRCRAERHGREHHGQRVHRGLSRSLRCGQPPDGVERELPPGPDRAELGVGEGGHQRRGVLLHQRRHRPDRRLQRLLRHRHPAAFGHPAAGGGHPCG